jgi:hypothetical protein
MKKTESYNTLASYGLPNIDVLDQLNDMVRSRSMVAFTNGAKRKSKIQDIEALKKYQEKVKRNFLEAIGRIDYDKQDLQIEWIDIVDKGSYDLIKLVFQSRPQHYVSAHLYKPKLKGTEKRAGILLACGHQRLGKDSEEYQYVAQVLVQNDLVVLVIDPIGQGERFSYIDPKTHKIFAEPVTLEHDLIGYQTQLLGYSVAKPMIFDHMRAIDLLQSLSYVDARYIGVTGNSGGGTMTSMLMMVDDRIQAAVPATFITSRERYQKTGQAQDREQHWKGLSSLGIDHEDILIAFAPKPVLVMAAEYDFFPIEGTIRSIMLALRMYEIYGAGSNLQYISKAIEHSYPPSLALEAAHFFSKVFYKNNLHKTESEIDLNFCEDSQVTKSHQVVIDYLNAKTLFNDNQEILSGLIFNKTKTKSNERNAFRFLNKIINNNRIETELSAKRWHQKDYEDYHFEQWTYNTQIDMSGAAFWFKPTKISESCVVALWPEGTSATDEHMEWILQKIKEGHEVIVVDLSGEGQLRQRDFVWWAKNNEWYGALYKLNDDLFWLNDSLAGLRIFETKKAIEFIRKLRPEALIEFYTEDEHVAYAAIANALLKFPLKHTRKNGLFSYSNWIRQRTYPQSWGFTLSIPNLLLYSDLDEILRKNDERTSL